MSEPGAAQDERSSQQWRTHVFSKHRILNFRPPYSNCKCGRWSLHVPESLELAPNRQRDYLLDGFLSHRKMMRAEKRRILDLERRPCP